MTARPESERVVINGVELPEELYPAFQRLCVAYVDCAIAGAQKEAEERAAAEAARKEKAS